MFIYSPTTMRRLIKRHVDLVVEAVVLLDRLRACTEPSDILACCDEGAALVHRIERLDRVIAGNVQLLRYELT